MSERQTVHIETLRVSAGALPAPEVVRAALPAAMERYLHRPAEPASNPVDQVALQVATAIESSLAGGGRER